VDEAAAEEEPIKEQAPRSALSLLAEVPSSAAACEELRSTLCDAALAVLLPPPGPASSRSDSEVVRDLVSGVFKRVLAASGAQVDEDPVRRHSRGLGGGKGGERCSLLCGFVLTLF
jgi:hypothetical protein